MSDKTTKSKSKATTKPKGTSKPKGKSKTKPKPEEQSLHAVELDAAPMLGGSDAVLGTLSAEPAKAEREDAAVSHARSDTQSPPVAAAGETPPSHPAEPLRVPRGGFIAFRKSGGLNFTSDEVVLFPDGRVAYDVRGVAQKDYNRLRRELNDAQVLSLRKLLDQSGFWRMESGGRQNPDAFAYEIAARLGQRSNMVEVMDGSVPEALAPLVERLNKLLPDRQDDEKSSE